jgi:hypothetical protein
VEATRIDRCRQHGFEPGCSLGREARPLGTLATRACPRLVIGVCAVALVGGAAGGSGARDAHRARFALQAYMRQIEPIRLAVNRLLSQADPILSAYPRRPSVAVSSLTTDRPARTALRHLHRRDRRDPAGHPAATRTARRLHPDLRARGCVPECARGRLGRGEPAAHAGGPARRDHPLANRPHRPRAPSRSRTARAPATGRTWRDRAGTSQQLNTKARCSTAGSPRSVGMTAILGSSQGFPGRALTLVSRCPLHLPRVWLARRH